MTDKNTPPELIANHLGKDQRRWFMWGRVCDVLRDAGRVTAGDLLQSGSGWITESQALQFLGFLYTAGHIAPHGYADVGIGRKMVRLTTYQRAS